MNISRDPQWVPVEKIRILNPRSRNKNKFKEIVESILKLGMKNPLVVSRRSKEGDDTGYDLVCGQGRLEAVQEIGASLVPAVVVDDSREVRLLKGLNENIARRNPPGMEMVSHIITLKERGYSSKEISEKTGLSKTTVCGYLRLMKYGEEGLLMQVRRGKISVNIAVQIATTKDQDIQRILTAAYEEGKLKGNELTRARKLVEQRSLYGKAFNRNGRGQESVPNTKTLFRAYNEDAKRQKVLVKKARACESYWLFILNGFQILLNDQEFVDLLDSEGLGDAPKCLIDSIRS